MYYIGTKSQCEYYLNKVNNALKFDGVKTVKWADIIEGKNNFAIIKHENYTHENMTIVEKLPEEFSQKETPLS